MTYAGSPLCAAVNALLNELDKDESWLTVERTEDLRRVHNEALFAEAQASELPDSRHEAPTGDVEPLATTISRGTGDLAESVARLDQRIDAFIVEHERAVDLLKGVVGLVQLVDQQLPDLKTNHRYVDAVAWLKQHEGVNTDGRS